MELHQEYVTLNVSDKTQMRAYVVRPLSIKPAAGLMVFQEAFGVNEHIRDVANRFAREGYFVISPEFFHRTAEGFEGSYTNFSPIKEHIKALTHEGMFADIHAAFDWLFTQGETEKFPIGAVGYCMGGRAAFMAAMSLPIACGVSYYGGSIAPNNLSSGLLDRVNDIQAPLLLCWAGLDKHIKPDQTLAVTQALRLANKPFTSIEFSDADHGFFCDARSNYNAAAAKQAWALTLEFLKSYL
jgi:carboxymethylenebutenolidase